MDALNGKFGSGLTALECPTVFVVGTRADSSAEQETLDQTTSATAS
jgi:hypothetical protein